MAAHVPSGSCCKNVLQGWSRGVDPAREPHVFNVALFFDLTPVFMYCFKKGLGHSRENKFFTGGESVLHDAFLSLPKS